MTGSLLELFMVLRQEIASELKGANQSLIVAKLGSLNSALPPDCLKAALRHSWHHAVPEICTGARDSTSDRYHLQVEQVD